MNRTKNFTKLSKSLLLGASATFLYTIIVDETANAMFRPTSKIPSIYRALLSTGKTGSQGTSSTLRNALGSSSIGNQNQNSLTTRPLNNPLTQLEVPQPQGNTNPSGNRPFYPYSGINNNNLTGTNPDETSPHSPTSPTGGQVITSNSINRPGLGAFIAHRLENFKDSSTNNSNGSPNQPNSIVPTGHVTNLKSTFEINNKTSETKTNSNNIQSTSIKNQSLNLNTDLNADKGKTSSLVAKFYDSTPGTPQTPPRVSELKKNFESETQSSTSSKQTSLTRFFGGKSEQNKPKQQSSSLNGNSETNKSKTTQYQSSDSTPTKGGQNIYQSSKNSSGNDSTILQTPTPTPPKVSELRKNFEIETQSNKNSRQVHLARFLGGKSQQNKPKQQSSSLSGSSETGKSKTAPSQSSDNKTSKGGENVLKLVAQFSGTASKTPEAPETSAPPKVSDLRKNFETSQTQSSTNSSQPTSNVSSTAKSFGGTVQQNKQKEQATQNKNSVLNLRGNFESSKSKTQSLKKSSQGGENVTSLVSQFSGTAPKTPSTPEEPTPVPPKVSDLKKNFETPKTQPDTNTEPTPVSVRNLAKTFENPDKQQPTSPSQQVVKNLAKNFGGIKGGNKSHPRQLTYEEMIQ